MVRNNDQLKLQLDSSDSPEFPYSHLLPGVSRLSDNCAVWEIDQTISELAYLTHNYFRYYGKFPSTVAAQILEEYPLKVGAAVLDNYCGSGTSLVEASRRSIPSVGIDISPLAVLAAKVKTEIFNCELLQKTLSQILASARDKSSATISCPTPENQKWLNKWFTPEIVVELSLLKSAILNLSDPALSRFFTVAFLAIIRRVSTAFDGEVRPHVNKTKKPRAPIQAFEKKCREMIERQREFNQSHPSRVPAQTLLYDASEDYNDLLPPFDYQVVISHPPYLNCFDYIQVYSLEFEWSETMPAVWGKSSLTEFSDKMRPKELKTTVRSNDAVIAYYDKLRQAYQVTHAIQPKNGICAVVIGDCKIYAKVEPVHRKLIPILEDIGYDLLQVNYRETHYATGKYSYDFRADYHGDEAEKKDAVMIFRKR